MIGRLCNLDNKKEADRLLHPSRALSFLDAQSVKHVLELEMAAWL